MAKMLETGLWHRHCGQLPGAFEVDAAYAI